jgi:hypothetical protein
MKLVLIALAALVLLPESALAEIPQVIGYQGKVTDNSGNPVADGSWPMRFRLYDSQSGGSLLWDSGTHATATSGGIFNVMLGESPHSPLTLVFDQDYWLLVTFDGEDQTPRRRLGSVGYAYMASGLVPGTQVIGSISNASIPAAAILGGNTAGGYLPCGLWGTSISGAGVYGTAEGSTQWNFGLYGRSYSTQGDGIHGTASATTGAAYGGFFESASTSGRGLYAQATATSGLTYGLYGRSLSTVGRGVYGVADAATGTNYGVVGQTESPRGMGVYGLANSPQGTAYAVQGVTHADSGCGVYGVADATWSLAYPYGVYGVSNSHPYSIGVCGETTTSTGVTSGVYGSTVSTQGRGVLGEALGTSGTNYGLYGQTWSGDGYGGYFAGDVHVSGTLSKFAGSFLIDHPLDPENRLLRHNFVESPENLLLYRGRTRLDARGEAVVEMPGYFRALADEAEATVNLTPVGKWTSAQQWPLGYEWASNGESFTAYGEPGREVAWIVMADRDDPVIRQLARPVEEDKGPDNKYCDRGKLLHPTAYGYPESRGRDYELRQESLRRREAARALTAEQPTGTTSARSVIGKEASSWAVSER